MEFYGEERASHKTAQAGYKQWDIVIMGFCFFLMDKTEKGHCIRIHRSTKSGRLHWSLIYALRGYLGLLFFCFLPRRRPQPLARPPVSVIPARVKYMRLHKQNTLRERDGN